MSRITKTLYFLVIVITIITSCKKNESTEPSPPGPPNTPPDIPVVFKDQQVKASLQGSVIDETGKPVSQATITAGNIVAMTDLNGTFRFNNIQLGKNSGNISIEKSGYFKSSRTILTSEGGSYFVSVQLIPKTDRGSFPAVTGGSILIENGAEVIFTAESIKSEGTGSKYTGMVHVKGASPDVSNPDLTSTIPGSLLGLNTKQKLQQLTIFGIAIVDLEDDNGQKLNITDEKTATLTIPISPALLTTAPDSASLWYYSDSLGLWKEQGYAHKQGKNYTGLVSHFSYWLVGLGGNYSIVHLALKDQQNTILPFYKVQLVDYQSSSALSVFTDSTGTLSFPVSEYVSTLQMNIFDHCTTLIYSKTIGPFSANTDLGIINATTVATDSIRIKGEVMNCDLKLVTDGVVDIELENTQYSIPFSNGNFYFAAARKICNDDSAIAKIVAHDRTTGKQTTLTALNVVPGTNIVPAIFACENSPNSHITYLVNDTAYINMSAPDYAPWYSPTAGITQVSSGDGINSTSTLFYLLGWPDFPAYVPGVFNAEVTLDINGVQYLGNPVIANIRDYSFMSRGEFMSGSFSGTLFNRNVSTDSIRVRCEFRIKWDL